jgi:hypothetical protein
VFDDSEIISYVKGGFDPDDVFSESELEDWAEANGYVTDD